MIPYGFANTATSGLCGGPPVRSFSINRVAADGAPECRSGSLDCPLDPSSGSMTLSGVAAFIHCKQVAGPTFPDPYSLFAVLPAVCTSFPLAGAKSNQVHASSPHINRRTAPCVKTSKSSRVKPVFSVPKRHHKDPLTCQKMPKSTPKSHNFYTKIH